MLKIHTIFPMGFASNCYLLTADGQRAVAIDPSQERIISEAQRLGLTIEAVLLTHGHFDHVGACNRLSEEGVPIYCGEKERELVSGINSMYREYGAPMPVFKVQSTLKDGQKIQLCGIEFQVIETPGHTAGSVCYLVENHLFTGDTLFRGSVGRCDLPTGDEEAIVKSVRKLYALDGAYNVYPGHSEQSTLDFEKKYNMCVRG